jgi:hypothetical protein
MNSFLLRAFLSRSFTADQATRLFLMRSRLTFRKRKVGFWTFYLVTDDHGHFRSVKCARKNPKGSGFLVSDGMRLSTGEIAADQPKAYIENLEELATKVGWIPKEPHDVAANLALVEEWAMRQGVLNLSKHVQL